MRLETRKILDSQGLMETTEARQNSTKDRVHTGTSRVPSPIVCRVYQDKGLGRETGGITDERMCGKTNVPASQMLD